MPPTPPTPLHQALLAAGYRIINHHVAEEDSRVMFWFYGNGRTVVLLHCVLDDQGTAVGNLYGLLTRSPRVEDMIAAIP
jgi:hypothetical protein